MRFLFPILILGLTIHFSDQAPADSGFEDISGYGPEPMGSEERSGFDEMSGYGPEDGFGSDDAEKRK